MKADLHQTYIKIGVGRFVHIRTHWNIARARHMWEENNGGDQPAL
jgi:hypothetical protein